MTAARLLAVLAGSLPPSRCDKKPKPVTAASAAFQRPHSAGPPGDKPLL